ncbi:MAG: glycine C-acetyltransferase [Defluviitaleaceae bacterium]|nr:glycine C-acetyltransferase [Defluviitaleaceae bacterium]
MKKSAFNYYNDNIKDIKDSGLWKTERIINTQQGAVIDTKNKKDLINMCSNNYLGLSSHPDIKNAAINAVSKWGYGLSSVRFICGTQSIHKELEEKLSNFLGTEDSILYSSCYDANGGLFETILSAEDAIISDELNHASIIDGVRLCKATRYRYKNNDMKDLEQKLKEAQDKRIKAIVTDGVFSMDGIVADLKTICDLAEKYDALVIVDDSHGVGAIGKTGRGTHEYCEVPDRVDIFTGTFGKALGGASGGYTSGRKEIIDILRQKSRTYLFSNSLSPIITETTIEVLNKLTQSNDLVKQLKENTEYFRKGIKKIGLEIVEGDSAIIPVMLYDEILSQKMAEKLYEKGVYAVGFFFPVVPRGKARVRTQVSAAHTKEQLDFAIQAFEECKEELDMERKKGLI